MCDCFGVDLFGARLHLSWMSFADVITNQPDAQLARVSWTRPVMIVFCHQRWRVGAWESISLTQIHLIPVPAGFIDSHTSPLSRMFRFIKGLCVQKWKCYVTQNFGSYISFFFSETKMSKMLFSVQRKHNAISGWSFSDWTKKNYKNHFSIINVLL